MCKHATVPEILLNSGGTLGSGVFCIVHTKAIKCRPAAAAASRGEATSSSETPPLTEEITRFQNT
jgi:hypothetical protein